MPLESLTKKKKLLDSFRPLPSALVQNLGDWFRVELTYTSNAIEGNTLTRALESEFRFEDYIFPKESLLRYGDNLVRFGDAYVADLGSGEISHKPKDGRGRGKVTHTHKAGVMAVRERYSPTDRRNQIYQQAPEFSSTNKRER